MYENTNDRKNNNNNSDDDFFRRHTESVLFQGNQRNLNMNKCFTTHENI